MAIAARNLLDIGGNILWSVEMYSGRAALRLAGERSPQLVWSTQHAWEWLEMSVRVPTITDSLAAMQYTLYQLLTKFFFKYHTNISKWISNSLLLVYIMAGTVL